VTVCRDSARTIAVLGDILDPGCPTATNEAIVRQLVAQSREDSIFEILQQYSGRYVVVVSDTDADTTLVIPDALCHRRVQFTDDSGVITSSPKLFLTAFNLERDTDSDVAAFIDTDRFWANEAAWPGKQTVDQRLTRLLPNHHLDVSDESAAVHRRPLYQPPVSSWEDVLERVGNTLAGTIAAVSERYDDVRIGLSAGWDSRTLLAASIETDATMFSELTDIGLDHPDIRVPSALAERFDLDYRIVRPCLLTDEFVAAMEANYCNPRLTAGERIIQHHWYDGDPTKTAVMGGNGSEILRAYYPVPLSTATPTLLADLYNYRGSAFARDAFAEWLTDAEPYAERTDINIFDLFYWEQRMGNWGSRRAYEGDIAANEIWPFNNYNLILAGLSIPRNERNGPDYPFYSNLVEMLRPEALAEPVNPDDSSRKQRVKARLKQAAHRDPWLYRALRYYRAART